MQADTETVAAGNFLSAPGGSENSGWAGYDAGAQGIVRCAQD